MWPPPSSTPTTSSRVSPPRPRSSCPPCSRGCCWRTSPPARPSCWAAPWWWPPPCSTAALPPSPRAGAGRQPGILPSLSEEGGQGHWVESSLPWRTGSGRGEDICLPTLVRLAALAVVFVSVTFAHIHDLPIQIHRPIMYTSLSLNLYVFQVFTLAKHQFRITQFGRVQAYSWWGWIRSAGLLGETSARYRRTPTSWSSGLRISSSISSMA